MTRQSESSMTLSNREASAMTVMILPTLRSSVQGFLRRQSQKNAEHVAADCLIELVRNRSCRQQVLRGSRCLLHTGARETCFVIVNRPGLTRSQRKGPSAITNALQPWLRRPRLVYGLDAIENLAEIALRDLKIIVVLRIEPKLCRCGNSVASRSAVSAVIPVCSPAIRSMRVRGEPQALARAPADISSGTRSPPAEPHRDAWA
jgi:hypothetical protein